MMKFMENIYNVSRIGNLVDVPGKWCSIPFRTPACLTYTRAGCIPHLTRDVLHFLPSDVGYSNISLQTLPTIINFKDSVKEFGDGLAKFVGLPDQPFHLSVQDPACVARSGYNTKDGVSVWSHEGRNLLSPKAYMNIVKSFLPFSYQALCDSDTPKNCSKKRLQKAVDSSLKFLDSCLEEHASSKELQNTAVFGTIEGGYDLELRKKSAEETAKRNVDGFVIDGFFSSDEDPRTMEFEDVKHILCEIIPYLPSDKPRILNGPFRPNFILEAVKCGIDIFDSSYAFILTENGEAMNLTVSLDDDDKYNLLKKAKCVFELNLKDDFYADHFSPIVKGCQCHTCSNFTSSYVHHLLVTKELLARVLLMIHNMHQFSKFFACIREAIERNCFEKLEKQIYL